MDVTLILVTLLSLALAAIMTVLAWRIAHEERRRADARVAALAAEIDRAPGGSTATIAAPGETPGPRVMSRDLPLHHPVPVVTATDLFSSSATIPASRVPRGVAAIVTVAGVIACAIVVWSLASRATRASAPASATQTATAPAAAAPLELAALTHDRDAKQLTVRGVVRNPKSGGDMRGLTAVVFVFNNSGGFITSGRTTIDELAPGSESPFAVAIPDAEDAARYRVSFRSGDAIVPHVDRRDRALAEAR